MFDLQHEEPEMERPARPGRAPETRTDDGFAVPYLRQGQHISLVKWSSTRDGWSYATLLADYVSRDEKTWHLTVRGVPARLPRDEWALFSY